MNITESRDEAFEAIAEMLRSNVKKTKIASQLAADYCVAIRQFINGLPKWKRCMTSLQSSQFFNSKR